MRGSLLYGPKGRLASGVAFVAGVLAAAVAAAQEANLFSLFPQKYAPFVIAIPVISLCLTSFAERLQGGASKPKVRDAAEKADKKAGLKAANKVISSRKVTL